VGADWRLVWPFAAKALNPKIEVIGVQSSYCPAMAEILYPDRKFSTQELFSSPLAEGIAVKFPGVITREILKNHLYRYSDCD